MKLAVWAAVMAGQHAPSGEQEQWLQELCCRCSPPIRAEITRRISAMSAALPPPLQKNGEERIRAWFAHALSPLETADAYRKMAVAHPQLEVLVLPSRFYDRASEAAARGIESEFARAIAPLPENVGQERRALLDQVRFLAERARAAIHVSLGNDLARELFERELAERLKASEACASNAFYGYRRRLSEEELRGLTSALEAACRATPILKPDADNPGLAESAMFAPDNLRVFQAVEDALAPLYQIGGVLRPEERVLRAELEALSREAEQWLQSAWVQHKGKYDEVMFAREASPQVKPIGAPALPATSVPELPANEPASHPRAPTAQGAPRRGAWAAAASILLLVGVIAFARARASCRKA